MTDSPKIISFAGQNVPEEGLTIHPPQGGELTIWPDGEYVFVPPENDGYADESTSVITYYSYIMEDIDGETSADTFSLALGEETSNAMNDFSSWYLPDLLQEGSEVANFALDETEVSIRPVNQDSVDCACLGGISDAVGESIIYDDGLEPLIVDFSVIIS